jgi:TRAP-type transport system periplasmic protein
MVMKTMLSAAGSAILMLSAHCATANELKLADFQPPTHFVVDAVYAPFSEEVARTTDNRLTVKVYMGGTLGAGPVEQYARVIDGVTDIAFGLPGYTASAFPKTLLTELPGVIQPDTGTQAIIDNADLLSSEYRRVKLLGLWNNAPNLLFTATKPVNTLADLKGLKIRVPSRNAGLVVQAWGATPVSMPAPDIYNAMQTGVIDGAMTDATTLKAFKLAEVTNYITMGMETTISSFFLIMGADKFDALSAADQQAVTAAGQTAALDGNHAWLAAADGALADFTGTAGKTVIGLTPDAAAAFNAASATVVRDILTEADAQGLEASAFVAALQSH